MNICNFHLEIHQAICIQNHFPIDNIICDQRALVSDARYHLKQLKAKIVFAGDRMIAAIQDTCAYLVSVLEAKEELLNHAAFCEEWDSSKIESIITLELKLDFKRFKSILKDTLKFKTEEEAKVMPSSVSPVFRKKKSIPQSVIPSVEFMTLRQKMKQAIDIGVPPKLIDHTVKEIKLTNDRNFMLICNS